MDIKIQQDLIDGMIKNGEGLRTKEATFLKAKGIDETIVKAQNDCEEHRENLVTEKEELKKLKADKVKAVSGITSKIVAKMNEILPEKNGFFDCSEKMRIGLIDDKGEIPFNGLSGYQLEVFRSALSNVMNANFIIVEAAEIDDQRLMALLEDLTGSERQIVVNTCHRPPAIPEKFKVVEL